MTSALNTAASALRAGQEGLATYAGDMAKLQVRGSRFEEAVYISNPGGVTLTKVTNVADRPGNDYTGRDLDLAIDGQKGYYLVRGRDGLVGMKDWVSLNIGPNGTLEDDEGNEILAWPTDSNGDVDPNLNMAQVELLEPIRVDTVALSADPTTAASLGINLPAMQDPGATESTTIEVFDSLGNAHTVTLSWTKVAPAAAGGGDPEVFPSTWEMTVAAGGGDTIRFQDAPGIDYRIRVRFDANGKPDSYTRFNGANWIAVAGANLPDMTMNWDQTTTAIAPNQVTFDISRITQIGTNYASTNNNVNGLPVGTVNGVSFNDQGIASLKFDNGQDRPFALLALGEVAVPNKTKEGTANRRFSSAESKAIVISPPKQAGYGAVAPKNLTQPGINDSVVMTLMIGLKNYVVDNSISYQINSSAKNESTNAFRNA